jgi:hypothetical protein
MALTSRRSARRSINAAAIGLLILGFGTSCGKTSESSAPVEPATTSPSASAAAGAPVEPTTTQSAIASGEVRLGCGSYCQSAGQYGAPGAPQALEVIKVVGGAVRLDPDGYVPVTLTCLVPVTCRGALQLEIQGYTPPLSYTTILFPGRSDLVVDKNSTQTIGVPLNPEPLAFARANSPVTVNVRGDADLTRCADDPQLAATCAQIVAADPRHIGNGLQTLFGGELQLSTT